MFVICTLNINGLNNRQKQLQVIDFMKLYNIDILLLQEHNMRDYSAISVELNDFCHVCVNESICHKGGTAILINRKLSFSIISEEKSADSRIISLKLKLYNQIIHIVNVYAHSGSRTAERDNLFNNEILYYLRNDLQNTYIGGDWNCLVSERDSTSDSVKISKSLTNLIRTLNLKDVWFLKHRHVEHTFVRNNFGSRIDRAYVKDLSKYINVVKHVIVNFSDHSGLLTELNLPDIPRKGFFYWKLNTSLLDDVEIRNRFQEVWNQWCLSKDQYSTVNEWWDLYVKKQIKFFFVKEGKEVMNKKYGLIRYLEYSLNRLYNNLNNNGQIAYDRVKIIKDRIDDLKNDILEGVKIRSRIQEQEEGERVSAFLIKKQAHVKAYKLISSIKTEENIVENLGPDITLTNKDSIEMYIFKYYQRLYKDEEYDEDMQDWFLKFVCKTLTNNEQDILKSRITMKEIFKAINNMNTNKAPGTDGIPIEFYLKYWSIIKNEIFEIISSICNGVNLNENQRKGILTLIPKDGDLDLLKTWRPVSLICCDVKIVAKILARRIGPLLYSLLSENQYCILGKSIIDCNTRMRDIMYYSEQSNKTGAVINVDWEKAFDRVNWVFLFRILRAMNFPELIVKWIQNLYTGINSIVLINGFSTQSFDICRGVRQGCPLSMMLFVIFQNPLYLAFENSNNVIPIELPGNTTIELGYADDTSVFINDDDSLLEIFRIINYFEKATNSRTNISKTKIYGFGYWEGRRIWPMAELKIEEVFFKALGIHFSSHYDISLKTMWKYIYDKIKSRIGLMKRRNFTLYQKAVLMNCLIASKLWYVAHIYPLPLEYCILINKEIFCFIWGSYTNPIKREVLYNKKWNGGLGLLSIYHKAKSIFVNTVIKSFLFSDLKDIIRFYMSDRIGNIFDMSMVPDRISNVNTPYYEFAIDTIKVCKDHGKFPNMKSKYIYEILFPQVVPDITTKYDFDWKNIFSNLNFKYISVVNRNVLFKYLYEILPTNSRLVQIRVRESPQCDYCVMEDSICHKFYYCCKVQDCLSWLRKVIFYLCGVQTTSLLKILYLDIPKINKRNVNSLSIIISCYISAVWFHRNDMDYIKNVVKAILIREQRFHMKLLGGKAKKVFSDNYCCLDMDILNRL